MNKIDDPVTRSSSFDDVEVSNNGQTDISTSTNLSEYLALVERAAAEADQLKKTLDKLVNTEITVKVSAKRQPATWHVFEHPC